MDFTWIKTIEQCDNAIQTFKSMGAQPPKELLDLQSQLKSGMNSIFEHLSRLRGYSTDLKTTIKETVDNLFINSGNAQDPGLLLGKIQCGKTRAFVGVMAMAFDQGVDAVIVLTKSDNGLVNQTKSRMEYEFEDFLNPSNFNIPKVCVYDVEENLSFSTHQTNNEKNIFVCHKNVNRLEHLTNIILQYFQGKKILIIDDEADFVSRAYYQHNDESEIGQNALRIDSLQQACTFSRYLQVTATPYSLFLQPSHEVELSNGIATPFKPRFTTLVPIHENYIGGKHYFVKSKDEDSMYWHLFHRISEKCMNHMVTANMNARVYGNAGNTPTLVDLRQALMSYLVGSAIRILQEKKFKRQYQTSFFIHVSTQKGDHQYEKTLIESILDIWTSAAHKGYLKNIDGKANDLADLFDFAYDDMKESNKKGNAEREIQISFPSKKEVHDEVIDILKYGKCMVKIVNSSTTTNNMLGKDGQLKLTNPLNIFVGGFKLDRGITIDHLIGFFYGRSPQNKQADTVLQHHRMYGNRSKEDMAVTRLHTTQSLYETMEWIDDMDHQLREMFIKALPGQPSLLTIQREENGRIIPCNRSRLIISDLETFTPFKRITPKGMQTGSPSAIKKIVAGIENEIVTHPKYKGEGLPFEITIEEAVSFLKRIRSTFIYDRIIDDNKGMDWDENIMISAIRKYAQNNKLWCYHVTGRDLKRKRKNGSFVDSPDHGKKDGPIAKKHALNKPILMFLKQQGRESQGWRDVEFYWPVLRLPANMEPCMYCKN